MQIYVVPILQNFGNRPGGQEQASCSRVKDECGMKESDTGLLHASCCDPRSDQQALQGKSATIGAWAIGGSGGMPRYRPDAWFLFAPACSPFCSDYCCSIPPTPASLLGRGKIFHISHQRNATSLHERVLQGRDDRHASRISKMKKKSKIEGHNESLHSQSLAWGLSPASTPLRKAMSFWTYSSGCLRRCSMCPESGQH